MTPICAMTRIITGNEQQIAVINVDEGDGAGFAGR